MLPDGNLRSTINSSGAYGYEYQIQPYHASLEDSRRSSTSMGSRTLRNSTARRIQADPLASRPSSISRIRCRAGRILTNKLPAHPGRKRIYKLCHELCISGMVRRTYMGGVSPLRPIMRRLTMNWLSLISATMNTLAPGTIRLRSPGRKVTTGTPSGTITVFSPSL